MEPSAFYRNKNDTMPPDKKQAWAKCMIFNHKRLRIMFLILAIGPHPRKISCETHTQVGFGLVHLFQGAIQALEVRSSVPDPAVRPSRYV